LGVAGFNVVTGVLCNVFKRVDFFGTLCKYFVKSSALLNKNPINHISKNGGYSVIYGSAVC
jgi:hypothetical protein